MFTWLKKLFSRKPKKSPPTDFAITGFFESRLGVPYEEKKPVTVHKTTGMGCTEFVDGKFSQGVKPVGAKIPSMSKIVSPKPVGPKNTMITGKEKKPNRDDTYQYSSPAPVVESNIFTAATAVRVGDDTAEKVVERFISSGGDSGGAGASGSWDSSSSSSDSGSYSSD